MKKAILITSLTALILSGCSKPLPNIGEFNSLSQIVKNGVAKDKKQIKKLEGKRVKFWGYLDAHNITNDTFYLKAQKDDEVGQGISIILHGEKIKYKKLLNRLRDRGENSTRVSVQGTLRTSQQNYNFSSAIGVRLEVLDVHDIQVIK